MTARTRGYRRSFTLIEVLLALMLLLIALPLTMAPVAYLAKDLRQTKELWIAEQALNRAVTAFFVQLHQNTGPVVERGPDPIPQAWLVDLPPRAKGNYQLRKIKEGKQWQQWQVTIELLLGSQKISADYYWVDWHAP